MSLLVVLGMHRSGTSALAGVLNRMGFDAGKHLLQANEYNARGYFEDDHVKQRLDALLHELGRSWHDERVLPKGWLTSQSAISAQKDLGALLDEEFNFDRPVVMKDPRVCRLLPLFQGVWHTKNLHPGYVISLRSPYAVIFSLARRDSMSAQRAALLYVAYLLEAEQYTRGLPRVFVEYEALLDDWRPVVRRISHGLQLDMIVLEQSLLLHADLVDDFLSSELNHFGYDESLPTGMAIDLALEVYTLLKEPMDEHVLSLLDDLRVRWLSYLDSLEPWLTEAVSLNNLRSELPAALYNPEWQMSSALVHISTSELFFANAEQDFAEERKITVQWSYGKLLEQRFVFPLIDGTLNSLRWDIADKPAFCTIHKIWLEDLQGQVQWRWQPREALLGQMSDDAHDMGLNELSQLQILASGFDPHMILMLPLTIIKSINKGWVFCVDWQAQLPTQALIKIAMQYEKIRQKTKNIEINFSAISDEREILLQKTEELSGKLALMERSKAFARDEITRAENQLILLKDLLILK